MAAYGNKEAPTEDFISAWSDCQNCAADPTKSIVLIQLAVLCRTLCRGCRRRWRSASLDCCNRLALWSEDAQILLIVPQDIAQWLPMVVEECQPWMPPESAPCVKKAAGPDSNLITAQVRHRF